MSTVTLSGHTVDRCWILHLELKPKFAKEKRGGDQKFASKAYVAEHSAESFASNPLALLRDFANFLQEKHGFGNTNEASGSGKDEPAALMSQFARFLADANIENSQGILTAFMTT